MTIISQINDVTNQDHNINTLMNDFSLPHRSQLTTLAILACLTLCSCALTCVCVCTRVFVSPPTNEKKPITAAATIAPTLINFADRDDDDFAGSSSDHRNHQRWQQHSVSVTLPIEQYDFVERLLQLEFPVAGPVEQSVPAALAHQQRKRTPSPSSSVPALQPDLVAATVPRQVRIVSIRK